jgi:hypothetical protein
MFPYILRFESNLDDLKERMYRRIEMFEDANEGDYPEQVQQVIGEGQIERNAREVDPHFQTWAENNPVYRAAKGNRPIGVLTGDMLSEANIMGRLVITDRSITVSYAGSGFDRQKMEWFAASGRQAWGLDASIRAALRELTREKVARAFHGGLS